MNVSVNVAVKWLAPLCVAVKWLAPLCVSPSAAQSWGNVQSQLVVHVVEGRRGAHLWDVPLGHEAGAPLCMGMQSLGGSPHIPLLGSQPPREGIAVQTHATCAAALQQRSCDGVLPQQPAEHSVVGMGDLS